MGAFRIIFTLTTMCCLTYCYELSFLIDLPQVVDSIANMASQAMPAARSAQQLQRANDNPDENDPTIIEKIKKFSWDVYGYVTSWFSSNRRVNYETMKPSVEVGPGVIKSEIMTYPENYFVRKLKLLLKSKKKEEEKKNPLN